MKVWSLGAVLLLTAVISGCGGNSTAIGVTVSAAGVVSGTTATVVANSTLQLSATATGGSASTVSWAICLPAAITTTQPNNCTAPLGPTGCTLPAVSSSALTGYGTITRTGLYTAPPTAPSPNKFVVMAISCVSPKAFGILNAQIDSGIRIQLTPATASIAFSEHDQFTARVTGTSNTAINWSVNNIAGGNATVGYICPNPAVSCTANGEYFAPATSPGSITITATSGADASKMATATVTLGSAVAPTLTSLDPAIAARGSAQQDVYLTGQNFYSTSTVIVAPPGQTATQVPTQFLTSTLLRATIPGALLATAGSLPIEVEAQNGSLNSPGPANLTLVPVRPTLIASAPDSVSQNSAGGTVNLTGGFFSPRATSVQIGGSSVGVATTVANSRQLSVAIPAGDLTTPGLYPIVVQNSDVPAGQPSMAAINLAVTPVQGSIPTAPTSSVSVGLNPSAVAIDYAAGMAVVVNSGDGTSNGSVSVVDLGTNPPSIAATVTVGKKPTGVAVDDLLSPHVALVVNSGDQTVSTINLATRQVVGTPLSVSIGPVGGSPAGSSPVPYSIGINPVTHHAVVAYQSFNEATILNVDVLTGLPAIVQQVGGNVTAPLGTGPTPAVAIDPGLNWAVITPGGGGIPTTNIVDLGREPGSGDVGRAPEVIGSIALPSTGIGINSETHQAFLADPSSGTFTSFSLLDNAVNTISFTNNGVLLNQPGYVAAAADPLENIGIAVNENSPTAAVVDLKTGNVLQSVTLTGPAQAVAIDPVSNQAVIVSPGAAGGNGSVSFVSLGTGINPLQIVETSRAISFTSTSPLALTITGSGFVVGSNVLVDGTPLTPASVSPNGRQIVAAVPTSMLGTARRYALQVQNPGGAVSNVTGLTVIEPIPVGSSPVGVAVDTDRDLAVVTNSGSGTVSLVALAPTTPVGTNQLPAGSIGPIGQPIPVGADPLGVAVLSRLGLALVANNGSNDISLVDVTQTNSPLTVSGCPSGACTGQMGVAINPDTAVGVVTNSTSNNNIAGNASNNVSFVTITAATATAAPTAAVSATAAVDLNPTAVAIDPVINPVYPGLGYAAVTTASLASSVQLLTVPGGALVQRINGLQVPTGIVFDPVNQVFLVANSLLNNVVVVDPATFNQNSIRVGINPTALDYNFQTSTLVTVNRASNTLSVLDYVCPPPANGATTACPNPQVRTVLGLSGSQQFSVAIDQKLNLAVLADQNNNRILLVPLPF